MKLQLTRPLAFIDIESTGTDREKDRIIELSICKVMPDMSRDIKTKRFNPGMPIPEGSTVIHGINDDDVKDEPTFRQCAKAIHTYVEGCDIAGFNSNVFDVPLLFNEFMRAGIYWDYSRFKMLDAGNIFKIQEPRTLSAAAKFYLEQSHEDAHSAEADVIATADIFFKQLERYEELPATIDELHLFCNYGKPFLDLSGKFSMDEKGTIILNFAKFKGEPAVSHLDFIEWMYYKADFPPDTRKICEQLLGVSYDETNEETDWEMEGKQSSEPDKSLF